MKKLWLAYAIVSIADLVLTCLYLSPQLEANPIASWIWSNFGYAGIILFKILTVSCLIYPACKKVERKRPDLAKKLLWFGIFSTGITCLLFGVLKT